MMKQEGPSSMIATAARQRGSIIVYILIAIFLTGLLVSAMSQGTKKSASSEQINELLLYLQADIQTVQSNITECVVSYQNNNFCPAGGTCVNEYTTQDTTPVVNPNVPFPTPVAAASSGGTVLTSIICPRAPAAQQTIFTNSVSQSLKLLQDTTNYTATYYNNGTDGVYIRITRNVADPLWTEALARLPSKYQACSTVVSMSASDPTGFNCSAGCFYYFIKRPGPAGSPVFGACP